MKNWMVKVDEFWMLHVTPLGEFVSDESFTDKNDNSSYYA